MAVNGAFIWNELVSSDQNASSKFFAELLGWERREVDTGEGKHYSIFLKDGRMIGGMTSLAEDGSAASSHWEPYISVDNVDLCVDKITRLGGCLLAPPRDIPEIGRVCLISDPTGAAVALVTEKNSS